MKEQLDFKILDYKGHTIKIYENIGCRVAGFPGWEANITDAKRTIDNFINKNHKKDE